MKTPIYDFVLDYAQRGVSRLHMPGHKGAAFLGCEPLDVSEIAGADELYRAEGIILESEQNASELFASRHTFYSAGGSSQSIRAMLYLALLHHGGEGRSLILAARNAHKAFLHACALLDLDVAWLYPEEPDALCACPLTPKRLEERLKQMEERPFAVYVTSPDYLGGMLDLAGLAEICRAYGLPLLVDNAHGAYLRFLPYAAHPLELGAAMCCDSAHKTLPVLTGGAYLHIARDAPCPYEKDARNAMALFGSTSPSYLILQSLDLCNRYLADGYAQKLYHCIQRVRHLKQTLESFGMSVRPSEPLKVVLNAAAIGITGMDLAAILRRQNIECEFAEDAYVVLMVTPETDEAEFVRLEQTLRMVQPAAPRSYDGYALCPGEAVLTPRQAIFSRHERVPVGQAAGRICASPTVSCPPAVPIAVSGERINDKMIALFRRYAIESVEVVC